MIRVIIYSSGDGCMQCRMTEQLMKAAGVGFERIDLSDPANAARRTHVMLDLGYSSVPVVEAGDGTQWVGFRPDCIEDLVARLAAAGEC